MVLDPEMGTLGAPRPMLLCVTGRHSYPKLSKKSENPGSQIVKMKKVKSCCMVLPVPLL